MMENRGSYEEMFAKVWPWSRELERGTSLLVEGNWTSKEDKKRGLESWEGLGIEEDIMLVIVFHFLESLR